MRRTVVFMAAVMFGVTTSISGATPVAAGVAEKLRVHSVQYNPGGPDDGTHALVNREWLELVNRGTEPINLRGYVVHDDSGRTYRFGDVVIQANGGRIWLRSGPGEDTARTVYWNSGGFVWDVSGDKAVLRNRKGQTLHTCSWSFVPDRNWVRCPVNP
ncbi:lamin tail domain-containing protein [Solwaraspora sp. WMMB335]|uniref:lamin tail domain-containing protein n=1 Tax=Solwaraspora sp. WMMB335 TaxID=3404118 RepID=UPI003B96714A